MKERRTQEWSAHASEWALCPVPDCSHIGDSITKAHCRLIHGIEREQVEKLHGKPIRVLRKTNRGARNGES